MSIAEAVTKTFVLSDEMYFHLRPASELVRELMKYESSVQVIKDGAVADGRSILELVILAAGPGNELTFQIKGPDAERAMAAVVRFFNEQFPSS